MKRNFVILLILILSNAFNAKGLYGISPRRVDRDLLVVPLTAKNDTARANFYYKEGFSSRIKNSQYSFDCAKKSEYFATKSKSAFHIAQAYNLLGILYYRKHDLSTALMYHKNALELRNKIRDKNGMAYSLTNLGNVYCDMKRYSLSENFYLKSLQVNNEIGNKQQVGNCLVNLGVVTTEQENIPAAKNYFLLAISNAKQRYDYELEAMCLNNLSVINLKYRQYDEAIANASNSLKTKELMDNEQEMADSYLNLASAYIGKNDILNAESSLKEAERIIEKHDYVNAQLQLLKIMADLFLAKNDHRSAFEKLSRYIQMKDSLELVTARMPDSISFSDAPVLIPEKKPFDFPFVYLNILIILVILTAAFVFRIKS